MAAIVAVIEIIISTHTPLAGRDRPLPGRDETRRISTHTPLAGRDGLFYGAESIASISTHTPLAGRDAFEDVEDLLASISTHTPLAGRDNHATYVDERYENFYSHAPRGARQTHALQGTFNGPFLLTRPSRGATNALVYGLPSLRISTHTPLAGRDGSAPRRYCPSEPFLLTRPSRGATTLLHSMKK